MPLNDRLRDTPLRISASGPADKILLTAFTELVIVQIIIVGAGGFITPEQVVAGA